MTLKLNKPRMILCLLFVAATIGVGIPSTAAQSKAAATDPEAALRKRVNEFYGLLRVKRVADAEKYVTADTVDQYRIMPQGDFIGVAIESIEFAPDKRSAVVMIYMTVSNAVVPVPFQLPRKTNWQLAKDGWRIAIPVQTTEMGTDVIFPNKGGKATAPPPKLDLIFDNYVLDFNPIKQGEVKVVKATFTNSTDHPITVMGVKSDCDCITMKSEKQTYKPGEKGEIAIQFDSKDYQYEYKQSIALVLNPPGKHDVTLLLSARIAPKY